MRIEITKGRTEDWIVIVRDDGTEARTRFPKKGPVPHDAVHVFVEQELGLTQGFWGMVAQGRHPEQLVDIARAAGHASAARARVPDADIVELLQAERLVEAFEAQLWSGGGDLAGLLAMAEPGCAASHVACPPISPAQHEAIAKALNSFAAAWTGAPVGHVAAMQWR